MAEWDYARSLRRIARLMGAVALAGLAVCFAARGLGGLFSYLGGAAISALSFYLLKRLVDDLQAAAEGRTVRPVSVLVHAGRVFVLGGAAYAIVRIYGADRASLAAGLLLAVVAATLDVLIELLYARA
jgi:hypothetical protein